MDIGAISTIAFKYILSPLIWLAILFIFIISTYGFLRIRKKRKLQYPTVEIVNLGNGKTNLNFLMSGWFGKNNIFKIWDYGDKVLKIKEGEVIHEFSEEDFQEIKGKRGIVCYRDPINRRLYPISSLRLENEKLIAEIAPREFTNTAIDIINDNTKETGDFRERAIQFILWGLVVVFSLVAIIVIAQMVKAGQTEASNLIVKAGEVCLSNAQEVCTKVCALKSDAP